MFQTVVGALEIRKPLGAIDQIPLEPGWGYKKAELILKRWDSMYVYLMTLMLRITIALDTWRSVSLEGHQHITKHWLFACEFSSIWQSNSSTRWSQASATMARKHDSGIGNSLSKVRKLRLGVFACCFSIEWGRCWILDSRELTGSISPVKQEYAAWQSSPRAMMERFVILTW